MGRVKLTKKRAIFGAGALLATLAAVVFGVGWYYAGQIEDGGLRVKHEPPEYRIEVVELGNGSVKLRFPDGENPAKEPETLGLEWPEGYASLGATLQTDGQLVTRRYTPLEGALAPGVMARADRFAFPGDPARAHGIPFEDISYPAPLGALKAWRVDGAGDTWLIFVHGRGSGRGESLRMLPAAHRLGLPSLVITYRNDEGAPADPGGYYWFGQTEWEDLEAAVQYALDAGASAVVPVGYSMGGGIVASFLYRSPLADRVAGVVLDSPMLDFSATVDHGAPGFLPGVMTTFAKWIAGWRLGIDWRALDYLDRASKLSAPVLLFHGDADETVPVATSDKLFEKRPDIVTYVRVAGAPHVGSWNADPAAYEQAVEDFLRRVALPQASGEPR